MYYVWKDNIWSEWFSDEIILPSLKEREIQGTINSTKSVWEVLNSVQQMSMVENQFRNTLTNITLRSTMPRAVLHTGDNTKILTSWEKKCQGQDQLHGALMKS